MSLPTNITLNLTDFCWKSYGNCTEKRVFPKIPLPFDVHLAQAGILIVIFFLIAIDLIWKYDIPRRLFSGRKNND